MEASSFHKYKQDKIETAKAVLRPYQKEAFETLVTKKRHLNYMDMGMGKGLVTLLAVFELEAFPCMIVCSKSAMGVLEQELLKWFDEEAIIYAGKPKQREQTWNQFVTKGARFIITNYSLCQELGQRFGLIPESKAKGSKASGTKVASASRPPQPGTKWKWKVGSLIADEIQLGGLFNHKTKTYQVFGRLAAGVPNIFLLTGTPYRRGVIDFYGPLSLIDDDNFDSYWKFIGRYCRTIDTGFGKEIERNPKDVVGFRKMIREYAIIMNKEDHLKDLPGKQRVPVPLTLEGEQERVYRELEEELFSITDTGELVMTPGIIAASVRLRQLLVAPQVLGLKARGAAIDRLVEMAGDLVDRRKPFVVFTPFKTAIPYIWDALREEFPTLTHYEISGGLTSAEFTKQWQGFQNGTGSRVLFCVIKSGSAFHATAADTAFFLGYEWDFNQNAQAEDRLNRIGQQKMVTCYYMLHKDTIDEHVKRVLNDKKFSSDLMLGSEEKFLNMIKRGK